MVFITISIITISIIGTLSHFLYEMSNHNKVVGLFTAVNESIWEHVKIALTPTLLWSVIDGFIYGSNPNYFIAKFVSLITIIILMPTLYYGHKALIKKELFIIDIVSFYMVIITSQLLFNIIIYLNKLGFIYSYLSCIGILLLFGGYMIHTLMPPKSILFKDPISNKYGYKGHPKDN